AKADNLLDELDFGTFEGQPKEQLIKYYGNQWGEHPRNLVLGESMTNLENRIILFLDKHHESANVLVFGHGAWIRAMISYHQHGHINHMNKITVNNNECI